MNDRVTDQRAAEAIGVALDLLPPGARALVDHAAYFTADALHAGLHHDEYNTQHGVPLRGVAHVCYEWHVEGPADRRRTTVVLPKPYAWHPALVLHEIGHVAHERLRFEPVPFPVTEYARTTDAEAFAEAWAAWYLPPELDTWGSEPEFVGAADLLRANDPQTVALFEALAL